MDYPKKINIEFENNSMEVKGEDAKNWYIYYLNLSPNGFEQPVNWTTTSRKVNIFYNILSILNDQVVFMLLIIIITFIFLNIKWYGYLWLLLVIGVRLLYLYYMKKQGK